MIKYPNKLKLEHTFKEYGNRGMTLEAEINDSNKYYLDTNRAVIYKKPTPVKVVKQVNYKIVDGYFEKPSTTDYNGLYKKQYIDFEAKETKHNKSFPLNNIQIHQINHIRNILNHGGICFLIVRFTKINETYLLFAEDFIYFIDNFVRKSIPYSYFKEKGYLIKDKLRPRVDYLEIIDKYGGIL